MHCRSEDLLSISSLKDGNCETAPREKAVASRLGGVGLTAEPKSGRPESEDQEREAREENQGRKARDGRPGKQNEGTKTREGI
jgi:hypothetical protein